MIAAPVVHTRSRLRSGAVLAVLTAILALALAGAPAADAAPKLPDCPAGTSFDRQSLRCEGQCVSAVRKPAAKEKG